MGALKDRVTDLMSNIQGCATCGGVDELEKLYNGKKKELGDSITPMMDIMVRDTITGRRDEIKQIEKEAKEAEAEKKSEAAEAKAAKKMDEYKDVVVKNYEDFIAESKGNLTSVDTAVFTFARMNPPTRAHSKLMEQMAVVGESVGGLPMVYLSHTQDEICNPLTYDQKIQFVESITPETVQVVESDIRNLFELLESLPNRGFNNLYAVVGNDRIDEFKRAGRYFLNKGGDSFTVVNSGAREGEISSTTLRDLVEEGDFAQFVSECNHLNDDQSRELYEAVEEGMLL